MAESKSRQEILQRFQKLEERKVEMAKDRNARVFKVWTSDGAMLHELAKGADKGIRSLRNNMLTRFDAKTVTDFLERFNEILKDLNDFNVAVSKIARIPYREPAMFKEKEVADVKKVDKAK